MNVTRYTPKSLKSMFYKDRVQILNPKNQRWVKINTKTGSIMGHKTDNMPYKNVMTVEERKRLENIKND